MDRVFSSSQGRLVRRRRRQESTARERQESLAARDRNVEDTVYQGFLTPIAAYGALVAVVKKRWDEHEREAGPEEQL